MKKPFDFHRLTAFEQRALREYHSWCNSTAPTAYKHEMISKYMKIIINHDLKEYLGIDDNWKERYT